MAFSQDGQHPFADANMLSSETFTAQRPFETHQNLQQHRHQNQLQRGGAGIVDGYQSLDTYHHEGDLATSITQDDRRTSLANSTPTMFSPTSVAWDDYSPNMPDQRHSMGGAAVFLPNASHLTHNADNQSAAYSNLGQWTGLSQQALPPQELGHHVENVYPYAYTMDPPRLASTSTAPGIHCEQTMSEPSMSQSVQLFPAPSMLHGTPAQSPPNKEEWMAEDDDAEQSSRLHFPTHMENNHKKPQSPGRTTAAAFINPSGVRKKNARFEIPQERNLNTIDNMIAETTDEEILKELKAQKRLLRNRQAALDSRHRKKKHTEELEREKEEWRVSMSKLESEVRTCREQAAQQFHLKDELLQARRTIDHMISEKEELIMQHTRETAELRRKISALHAYIQSASAIDGNGRTAAAFNHSYDDIGAEDPTAVGRNWQGYMSEPRIVRALPQVCSNQLVVTSRPKAQAAPYDNDKTLASSVMYTILLFGAWIIASKAGNKVPPVPEIPLDIATASTAVITDVFRDVSHTQTMSASTSSAFKREYEAPTEPRASHAASIMPWPPVPKNTLAGSVQLPYAPRLGDMETSTLGQMHYSLTTPGLEEQNEQLFGLSVDQYSALTDADVQGRSYDGRDSTPRDAEYGSVHDASKAFTHYIDSAGAQTAESGFAEVFSRSLLWDQIPRGVLEDFRNMVLERNKARAAVADA